MKVQHGPPAPISIRTEAAEWVIEASAVVIGEDLLVYIWGGERPHIGAVAAAQPRPSLADPARISATASVLTYPGHKEDEVVKRVAEALASACDRNVVVTAGIHWDDLEPAAIKVIGARIGEIIDKLIQRLGGDASGPR